MFAKPLASLLPFALEWRCQPLFEDANGRP